MLYSTHLASAALALLLALPGAAFAQSAQLPSTTTTPSAPPAASAPINPHGAPGSTAAQRVEAHIKELHSQLRITAAEQPQWEQFANVMRENARAMDREFAQRAQQFPTMNALQDMQSYERIADAHARHLQKLVPAFEILYNAMPEQQKQLADQVFRANAQAHAQKRMQTGRNEVR
jgi:periplasmic protein CpxP/Spy